MRYTSWVVGTFFLLISLTAYASPTHPSNGAEYITLDTQQPVSASGKKIEVVEFFMYHCPACQMLEPQLSEWVSSQGDRIVFRRIPFLGRGSADVEAHLFLTLEAMQLEQSMHKKVLAAWHVEHKPLLTDDDNLAWAQKNDIDKDAFLKAYQSFAVTSKLQDLPRVATNYQVDSTPTIIVDGRYLTSMTLVHESNQEIPLDEAIAKATVQVIDALVRRARADK